MPTSNFRALPCTAAGSLTQDPDELQDALFHCSAGGFRSALFWVLVASKRAAGSFFAGERIGAGTAVLVLRIVF